ncbi:MAG: efflux RND transporter permease subunit [Desulfobacterales bacterium]|jgi:predicted RND superfamily exporter protein
MANIRNQIEKWFESFARIVYRHRIKTTVITLAAVAVMVSQIPKITLDTSTEGFLHAEDPALLAYNDFRDQFGRDEVIIIALNPPQVFDRTFLEKLKAFHEELAEKVPHVDDITSLINARNTRGKADELIVEDLLEKWPESRTEMAALKQRVMTNPIYQNLLISEDGSFTTIVIKTHSHSSTGQDTDILEGFADEDNRSSEADMRNAGKNRYLTDAENSAVVKAVRQIIAGYRASDFPVYIAGSPVVTHFLKRAMMNDIRKFMMLAIITAAVILFIMFRRISGVILPLVVVILSLLCTIGVMAVLGVAIKVPTQILPSFLLAVGVGTSVHILAVFFHRFQHSADKEDAIIHALGHSGLAVVMTNVTTATGLFSFATADVAPVADIGIYAAVGVLLAFVFTIVLLPALLALIPLSTRKRNPGKFKMMLMDRFLSAVGNFATRHSKVILVCSAIVMALSMTAISKIRFSHHVLGWFPKTNSIRMATEKIDAELRGSLSLEAIIDTHEENGLHEPQILNRLDAAAVHVESLSQKDLYVGKAWSLTAILKEIHQALNENRSGYYAIPQDRELVAQEFLLFENSGSDDLEDVVDSQFSKARLSIKVPFKDAVKAKLLLEAIRGYLAQKFPQAKITITGMMALLAKTVYNAIQSMAKSYAIALVVITVLMILLIGRIRIGLLSMVPNLAPILLMLGVIGAFSLPMDLFTMMVASVAIGLAVDDTIHFMHNFRRYYEQSGDPRAAVHETLQTAGRAMLVTTVVLSIGFFIFAFATMNNVINFGLLTGFTIIMALVADYLIAPALMIAVNRPKSTGTLPRQVPPFQAKRFNCALNSEMGESS